MNGTAAFCSPVRLLATYLLVVLTVGVSACGEGRELNDGGTGGAETCYGGQGVAVTFDVAGCSGATVESQLRLSSGGAEHVYDYSGLAGALSERWPIDFHDTDPGEIHLTATGEGCALDLTGSFVVSREACVVVPLAPPPSP
jgi:hypothetical protein